MKADIVLEKTELINFNEKTGEIQVDKEIFDDYVENSYINIEFTDYNEEKIFQYKMIKETEKYITMEFIG